MEREIGLLINYNKDLIFDGSKVLIYEEKVVECYSERAMLRNVKLEIKELIKE